MSRGRSAASASSTANRSKRSVVIDLDAPEGRNLFRSLAERSDILVEDRTPGYFAGLGLGYTRSFVRS